MQILNALGHALELAGSMAWEILWSLVFGFFLSAAIEAVVRKDTVVRLMGDDRLRSLGAATGLGAVSSSCSYAAVALARSLFRKGADFTAVMAFEIASTNLVIEMAVILALLLGWQFTLAEFVGGPLMILVLAVLFRLFLRDRILRGAREQAEQGLAGKMEGHAGMDMSVAGPGSWWRRLTSRDGITSTAQYFGMNWASVWADILGGLLIAGAFAAWVPTSWLQHLFLADHDVLSKVWGPLIGPLLAVISFVCSIGNIPLAAVLWDGGISFGGVVSFIFADLIVIPVLLIYRKYYGTRMALFLFGTFYAAMAAAGYVVELVFTPLGLAPDRHTAAMAMEAHISWNYTTWLNIVALLLAAALTIRFLRTGGVAMLAMMSGQPDSGHDHATHQHRSASHHTAEPGHVKRQSHHDSN